MGLFDWSTTASENTSVEGENIAEGMSPPGVNNAMRAITAVIAKFRNDTGGKLTTGGVADAYTVTLESAPTAYADGMSFSAIIHADNTGATTLNASGIGGKKVLYKTAALTGGELVTGQVYRFSYDASADSAAGAWLLENPSPVAASLPSYTSNDIGDDSNYGTGSVTAALNAIKASFDALVAGVSTAYDTLAEIETKFGQVDSSISDIGTELDVILPDGGTGTFTRPRMTTTARDALDMTGKAAGYEIYNTTTGQVEAWDGTSAWAASGGSDADAGALRTFFEGDVPASGWTFKYLAHAFSGTAIKELATPAGLSNPFLQLAGDYYCVFDGNSSNANDPGYRVHKDTGVSTTMPAQPVNRTYYGANCVLDNGMILQVGGYDQAAANAPRNTWWIYDPATNTFPHNGTFIGGTVHSAKVVRANDGAVYLFHGIVNGGANQNIYKFDQTTRVWTDTSINTTRANSSMSYHACGLLPSGKIGIFHSPSGTDQCDIFDPAGPSIAQGGVIGESNVAWMGTRTIGGTAYAMFQKSNEIFLYDEGTEAITPAGQASNFSWTSGHTRPEATMDMMFPSGTDIDRYFYTYVMEKDA